MAHNTITYTLTQLELLTICGALESAGEHDLIRLLQAANKISLQCPAGTARHPNYNTDVQL